ncbi:MAG: RluA family pseudouridine synthase [Elusimicrobiota bacterium]
MTEQKRLPEEIRVPLLEIPQRLDVFLTGTLATQGISRTLVKRFIDNGWVMMQGRQHVTADLRVTGAELIRLTIPVTAPLNKKPMRLEVLYEDKDLVIINKPSGLITHPRSSLPFQIPPSLAHELGAMDEPSVLTWVLQNYPKALDVPRLGIVHRLDADASGALMLAKTTPFYHKALNMFENRAVSKTYLAVVWGKLNDDSGVINLGITKRYTKGAVKMGISQVGGREAITEYAVKKIYKKVSLVELYPKTGRTHQLRLHMAALGHPICGDRVYNRVLSERGQPLVGKPIDAKDRARFTRLMLHAWKLEFERSGKTISATAPRPKEFLKKY